MQRRTALGLEACADEQDQTVRQRLVQLFRRYGMPFAILTDNGAPWGDRGGQPYTAFGVWLIRHGIRVVHGRPYHPQTQGKDERFHGSLQAEVLNRNSFADLAACQRAFDRWRQIYNHERPHEALGLAAPVTRYRVSPRPFPERLAPIEYAAGDVVRKVCGDGFISFKGTAWRIGQAFRGERVALRPGRGDGLFSVHYCTQPIAAIDLREQCVRACGFVGIAPTVGTDTAAMPTTPQAQQSHHAA